MMSKPDPRPGEAPYLETGPWQMDRGGMRSLGGPGLQEEGMEADTQGKGSGREAQDAGAPSEGPGRKGLPQVSAGAALQALATRPGTVSARVPVAVSCPTVPLAASGGGRSTFRQPLQPPYLRGLDVAASRAPGRGSSQGRCSSRM